MFSVSQTWKEKMGCYLMPNRDRLAPEQLIKLEYNIDNETLTFDKSDIISFSHKQSCDLNSLTLPKNEIQFEIDNSDGRWNPDNPTGLYQKITEKQKVELYYGLKNMPATKTYTNIMPERADAYTNSQSIRFMNHMTYHSGATSTTENMFVYQFTPEEDGLYYIGYETWIAGGTPRPSYRQFLQHQLYKTGTSPIQYVIQDSVQYPVAGHHYSHTDYYMLTGGQQYRFHCSIINYNAVTEAFCAPFIVKVDNNTTIPSGKKFLLDEVYSTTYLADEWHKAGTFYMSGWDTPQNGLTATFTATSQLDFGKDKFGEVVYWSEPSMYSVCVSAFNHMGMPSAQSAIYFLIDNSLRNYPVPYTYTAGSGYQVDAFKNMTDAAVVQLCANAAMCRIRYNVNGKIYVEPMTLTGVELGDYTIDPFVSYRNAEYTMSKPIKDVVINNNLTVAIAEQGQNQQISNSLITTQLHANQFGGWLTSIINTRKEVNGEYRSDPRLQVYDYIKIINKYAVNEAFITAITYTYNGSFKGTYEGRVMKSISSADLYGNYYAGDHNKANSTIS